MGVYHITYSSKLNEICFFFDKDCNFSCRGCITRFAPLDYHLRESLSQQRNGTISVQKAIEIIEGYEFRKAIYMGLEPTVDPDFLLLGSRMKECFETYNVLITNGYKYIEDEIIDEVCVSVKAVSEELFKDFTGQDKPQRVLENLRRYAGDSGRKARAESIFIPGYIDTKEIGNIARSIAAINRDIPYRIDAYIPIQAISAVRSDFRAPTIEEMKEAKKTAHRYLSTVSILHDGRRGSGDVRRLY